MGEDPVLPRFVQIPGHQHSPGHGMEPSSVLPGQCTAKLPAVIWYRAPEDVSLAKLPAVSGTGHLRMLHCFSFR